jgi:hypothetical protein
LGVIRSGWCHSLSLLGRELLEDKGIWCALSEVTSFGVLIEVPFKTEFFEGGTSRLMAIAKYFCLWSCN